MTIKSNVPKPAQNNVTETVNPLLGATPTASVRYPEIKIGTRIVAPNIANICCSPKISIFGIPSVFAS